MSFSPQELLAQSTTAPGSAKNSSSSATTPNSAAMADPNTMLISAIAGAVDSIFGTIGSAITGKTKKDLTRQQGNQQLVQQATNMHQLRMQNARPVAPKKDHTSTLIIGLVALFVFVILLFTLKKP